MSCRRDSEDVLHRVREDGTRLRPKARGFLLSFDQKGVARAEDPTCLQPLNTGKDVCFWHQSRSHLQGRLLLTAALAAASTAGGRIPHPKFLGNALRRNQRLRRQLSLASVNKSATWSKPVGLFQAIMLAYSHLSNKREVKGIPPRQTSSVAVRDTRLRRATRH